MRLKKSSGYSMYGGGGRMYQEGGMAPQGGQKGQDFGPDGKLRQIQGQNTSKVQLDEETGEEYVMYETSDGYDMVPIYGDWESYGNIMAPGGGGVGPGGDRYIEDRVFPVVYNREKDRYELNYVELEREQMAEPEQKMAREAVGGPGASPTEDLLEKLGSYMRNR